MIKVEEVVYGQRKVIVILFIVFFSMLFMHTYMALFPMGLLLIIGFVFFRKHLSMRKFGKMKLEKQLFLQMYSYQKMGERANTYLQRHQTHLKESIIIIGK